MWRCFSWDQSFMNTTVYYTRNRSASTTCFRTLNTPPAFLLLINALSQVAAPLGSQIIRGNVNWKSPAGQDIILVSMGHRGMCRGERTAQTGPFITDHRSLVLFSTGSYYQAEICHTQERNSLRLSGGQQRKPTAATNLTSCGNIFVVTNNNTRLSITSD